MDAINQLRLAAYARAHEFAVINIDPLKWQGPREDSITLCYIVDGRIVASMQGDIVNTNQKAKEVLGRYPTTGLIYPALILSKAATEGQHENKGINFAIRREFFRLAKSLDVKCIAGALYNDALRMKSMAALGYEFFDFYEWDGVLQAKKSAKPLLAVISRENFLAALANRN
jgi:hypothetical protein